MEAVVSLLILTTLPQLVVPQAELLTSFRAVAELVSQESRIFSGESVRLRCRHPSPQDSPWSFQWFKGSERLPQGGEYLVLWNTKDRDSGKYYCQGVRYTTIRDVHTLKSHPVEITVDGGWAILRVPHHPSLVQHTLSVTCLVRGNPKLQELILYKDGFEVMRQEGPDPTFHLPNLTLQDTGMYSCRASWDVQRRTRSVISAEAQVQVLEVLSQPVLEIETKQSSVPESKMMLICRLQYNVPAPAPPLIYYFYKDDNKLSMAMSKNHLEVTRTPGHYKCKAKVPRLGLTRWSEPRIFGQETGPKTTMPPILHPRDPWANPWPLVPPNSSPESSLPRVAEPEPAKPLPEPSTTSTHLQPTEVSFESSNHLLNLSQPTQDNLPSTVQPIKEPANLIKPVNIYEESGEMSGQSGDTLDGSGDMVEGSGSGDVPNGSGDMVEGSGDMYESSGVTLDGSGDLPEGSGDIVEGSGDMAEGSGVTLDGSGDMAEGSGDLPEGFWDMS